MHFGIPNFWTYVVGTFFIIVLPGPNSLFVLATAARHGVRMGFRAAAGVALGDTVLMLLALGGAASLLKSTPALFNVVKYLGACYLAWIGLQMLRSAWKFWRSPDRGAAAQNAVKDASGEAAGQAGEGGKVPDPLRKAVTICLLNPKSILFFVAFFSQFVDPDYPNPVLSFTVLGVILQLFSLTYLTTMIFGGTYLAGKFRERRKLSAGVTSGVGVLFISFSAKLATAVIR